MKRRHGHNVTGTTISLSAKCDNAARSTYCTACPLMSPTVTGNQPLRAQSYPSVSNCN
jgi:hypothetical protein